MRITWDEQAWQTNLALGKASDSHGSTSATPWMHYELKKASSIDQQATVFLNSETCEMKAMVLTEEESLWLRYGSTVEPPTERLHFYHGTEKKEG